MMATGFQHLLRFCIHASDVPRSTRSRGRQVCDSEAAETIIEAHLSVSTDLHQLAGAQVHFHPGVAELDIPQQQSHHLLATSCSASHDIGKHSWS